MSAMANKSQPVGGGNSNILYFHPEHWGLDDPILTNIFQMN